MSLAARLLLAMTVFGVVIAFEVRLNSPVSRLSNGGRDLLREVTAVDRACRWLESRMGFYRYEVSRDWVTFSGLNDDPDDYRQYEELTETVPAVPPPRRSLHELLVDLVFVLPAFMVSLIVYHLGACRGAIPRCRACGCRLLALASARCPRCGTEL